MMIVGRISSSGRIVVSRIIRIVVVSVSVSWTILLHTHRKSA